MHCAHCGIRTAPEHSFCPSCGQRLRRPPFNVATSVLTPPPQPETESDQANRDRRPAPKAVDPAEPVPPDETRIPGLGEADTVVPLPEPSDDATRVPLPPS